MSAHRLDYLGLPPALETQIRRHSESQYPHEACGAVLGSGDGVTSSWLATDVLPSPNEHDDDRTRRYLIPPEFQFRAEQRAREMNQDVVGYYHSHPDHPALPSEYDRVHAWAGYVYIICSVEKGRSADVGAFALDEQGGQFQPVGIRREE